MIKSPFNALQCAMGCDPVLHPILQRGVGGNKLAGDARVGRTKRLFGETIGGLAHLTQDILRLGRKIVSGDRFQRRRRSAAYTLVRRRYSTTAGTWIRQSATGLSVTLRTVETGLRAMATPSGP